MNRTMPCLKCAANTTHTLTPSDKGASWQCTICANQVLGYTREDMMKIVSERIFGVPEDPKTIDVPEDLKVYIEYSTDESMAKEALVDSRTVKSHIEVTGQIPKVGKPLMHKVPGAPKQVAIPFGKVVRVEGVS